MPNLTDIYNTVAAKADTEGVKINVAETKRVLACLFDVLQDYSTAEALSFLVAGIKRSNKRRR